MSEFWLYRWLDENGVNTVHDAKRALLVPGALDSIRTVATTPMGETSTSNATWSLAAGRGIDLSGHLDCNAPSCRSRQVDDLLSRVWFYFDDVAVADAVSHEVTAHWDAPARVLRPWILSHIEVLLHLRATGAAPLVRFSEKPRPCELHWQRHAEEAGLGEVAAHAEDSVGALMQDARINTKPRENGGVDFSFVHPRFEHTVWGECTQDEITALGAERAASFAVFRRYLAHLTSDVAFATNLGTPLGSSIWLHEQLLRRADLKTRASPVMELQLPVLDGLSIADMVRVRADERDAFLQFRMALRKAFDERLRLGEAAATVSAEIQQDLVEPGLQEIRSRLKSAERLLAKKTVTGIVLSSLVTTCGLLAGLEPSLAVGAGVGTLATLSGGAAMKDLEERREVELSDMYFLWAALKHSPHKEED